MVVNRWQAPELTLKLKHSLLQEALAKAWRAPFFARKLEAAGIRRGQEVEVSEWARLPVTTKDELRLLTTEEFYRDVVIAPRGEVADYWRSGGVTGKPIFYPRTHQDMLPGVETFRRVLDMVGITTKDTVANSFPYGVHPLGRMMLFAAQSHGCATVGTGAGTNTTSEQQAELIANLGVDVLMVMGTYALQLANAAKQMGIDVAETRVRTLLSSADVVTPAKRARLERLWKAEVFNGYGMSEAGFMACECEKHDGMHIWADMFHLEVLDEETMEPVPEGATGVLTVTPLYTNNATPFIRWVSGDLVSLTAGCGCKNKYGYLPVLRLAGRTTGFFKIRGVNINHVELEDLLLSTAEVADYRVTAILDGTRELLRIEVEPDSRVSAQQAVAVTSAAVERAFGLAPSVMALDTGVIARELQNQVKQTRVFDRRFQNEEA
jgi:phenylacetate-CoA ligase